MGFGLQRISAACGGSKQVGGQNDFWRQDILRLNACGQQEGRLTTRDQTSHQETGQELPWAARAPASPDSPAGVCRAMSFDLSASLPRS